NARQLEVLFPIRPLFEQWSRTVANLNPMRSLIVEEPRIPHIAKVFPFCDGSLAQCSVLDSFQKRSLAPRFHARSHQISHLPLLYRGAGLHPAGRFLIGLPFEP